MKSQDLKKSILQYAMQGKLVPQDPNDEPASELLKRIKAQKEQLIKEGKIKKEKPLPPITQDEIPYDLPQSWGWVRLANIINYNIGRTPPRKEFVYWDNDYNWVSIADMIDGQYITTTKEKVSQYAFDKSFKGHIVPKETLIMSFKLTVGKVSILGINSFHNEAIISIYPIIDNNNSMRDYLFKFLPLISQNGNTKTAIKGNTLNTESINNLLIPLPPLAEQKRIVEKLEDILPLVDEYGKNEEILSEMNQKLPKQIRQSILQYAVQGKLVEQNPQDEPASELLKRIKAQKDQLIKDGKIKKEKPLPPITQDEIPYDLPQGWEWVRISEIMTFENGDRSKNYPTEVDYKSQGIPFYGAKDIINNKLSKTNDLRFISIEKFDSLRSGKLRDKDIVCLIRGSVGKWAEFTKTDSLTTGFINAQMVILRLLNLNLFNYLKIYLSSPLYLMQINNRISGSAVAQMSAKDLSEFIIPLPPLAEQKRIVAKVEELMTLVNKLE